MTLQPGQSLSHYRLIEKIGQGGMGEVYRAEDTTLRREVAIKVLPPELAAEPDRLARFKREAESVAALNHPSIVTVFAIEELDGIHFMSLELVQGESLRGLIPKRGLPAEMFLELATTLADAVSAAHQQGITHRDLKPENVMVGPEGRLKVLDFGLAKLAESPAGGEPATQLPTTAKTEEGKVMGTVAYMSPEQAEGKPVDPRSDVFSLGVVLYEMATGVRPFQGESTASIISSILRDSPPPPTEVNGLHPRGLDRIIRRCLAKDPSRRYQSALEIRNELEVLIEEHEVAGSVPEREAPGSAVAPARVSLGAVALTALATAAILVAGWYLMGGSGIVSSTHGPTVSFRRLTWTGGAEIYPSISPDGSDIAYASTAAGNLDIWIQRVGGRKAINLTAASEADETTPAFSPDGQKIIFRSERDGGGLFVMGATGESVKRLTTRGCNPAWSPDGREIAYTTECFSQPTGRGSDSGLWIVDLATGEERKIEVEDAVQPSWSPDGVSLVFWAVVGGSGQRDLWTVRSDGKEPARKLTDDPALDWSPVWSPDGRWIYFSSNRSGNDSLWRLPVEPSTGRRLGEPEVVTLELAGRSMQPSIDASGRRIAFASATSMYGVQALGFDPERMVVTEPPRWVLPPAPDSGDCRLSPDGTTFACTNSGSVQEDVWVVGLDGSNPRYLTEDAAKDRGAHWNSDGSRVYFYSDRNGSYEIWSIRPDGSGLTQHTDFPGRSVIYPVLSPDGSLLGQELRSGRHPFLLDAGAISAGEGEVEYLPPTGREGENFIAWNWSSDGRRLAGLTSIGFPRVGDVAIYDRQTGEYSFFDSPGRMPVWVDGGRRLVIADNHGLHTLDTATGEAGASVSFYPDTIHENTVVVAEGGWRIYFSRAVHQSDIWLMELGSEGAVEAP